MGVASSVAAGVASMAGGALAAGGASVAGGASTAGEDSGDSCKILCLGLDLFLKPFLFFGTKLGCTIFSFVRMLERFPPTAFSLFVGPYKPT
jgi:hypothetical protein